MIHSPWFLLLLITVPWMAYRLFGRRERPAIGFSSVALPAELPKTLRQRLLWVPGALTLLSSVLVIAGLARPQEGRHQTISTSDGIAIELVVDRSGSMRAMDFKIDGEHVDRLTAIKNVAGKFVMGGDDLTGRISDLIGLISFAGYADAQTPPTLDHSFLVAQLNQTQIVTRRDEDGTAIGDAVSLAVEKLTALDSRNEQKVKSRIIILLTDGENTAGNLEPIQAAELAQTLNIKIYTIGVGTQGQAPMPVRDVFGREAIQWVPVNIDEATLKKVAELTNGRYFRATDTDSLEQIYAEIDALEKTAVESQQFTDYLELAIQSGRFGRIGVPPILLVAFVLLTVRIILQQTLLRETV
ncbi:MAG: VWA domain-containing protein [Planctomycetaceae bacterium]